MSRLRPVSIRVDAPAEQVWDLIGPRFDQIGLWASAIPRSVPDPSASSVCGAPIGGRVCASTVPMVPKVSETIMAYDDVRMELTYRATSGTPFFVANATNTWTVDSAGSHASTVTVAAMVEPKGSVGRLLLFLMSPMLARMGRRTLEDLKYYVEHATPSPRKRHR